MALDNWSTKLSRVLEETQRTMKSARKNIKANIDVVAKSDVRVNKI